MQTAGGGGLESDYQTSSKIAVWTLRCHFSGYIVSHSNVVVLLSPGRARERARERAPERARERARMPSGPGEVLPNLRPPDLRWGLLVSLL